MEGQAQYSLAGEAAAAAAAGTVVVVRECASGEAAAQRWGLTQEGAVTQGERCLALLSPDTRIFLQPCAAGPKQVSRGGKTGCMVT